MVRVQLVHLASTAFVVPMYLEEAFLFTEICVVESKEGEEQEANHDAVDYWWPEALSFQGIILCHVWVRDESGSYDCVLEKVVEAVVNG